MTRVVPLHQDQHANLKVKDVTDFSIIQNEHIIPLVVHEFVGACTDMPIIFVKDVNTGHFQVVAMLGLKPKENLLLQDGKWEPVYVPALVKHAPFRLIPTADNSDQLMLGIDEDSVLCGEGEALYNEDKSETEYLVKRKEAVIDFFEKSQVTGGFITIIRQLDLLVERTVGVTIEDDRVNLNGLYVIDEEKLMALPEDKFMDLKKRGFLPAIYAHMISINQIGRLAKIKTELQG